MQNLACIQSFAAYIATHPLPGKRRQASKNTQAAYLSDLTLFSQWFEDRSEYSFDPPNITREDIQDYVTHLRDTQDAAVSTIQRKYASIRAFCAWAVLTNQVQYNQSEGVALPTEQRLAPEGLNRLQRAAIRRVFNLPSKETPSAKMRQVRDQAIIFVMMYAGLRISEIESLKLADLVLRDRSGEINIRAGKGDKDRTAALPLDARNALGEWLEKRPECNHDFVFTTTRRGHSALGRRAIQEMVTNIGRQAELDKSGIQLTPHVLRHTAVRLWRKTNNPFVVAAQMGHKNIQTTMHYDSPSSSDLKRGAANVR